MPVRESALSAMGLAGYPDRQPPRRSPAVTETASRPTLEAVAARAGVSRATVSRVVNGGEGVREPLVERVLRAVEELGYVPNQAARSLVTKRHDAVAVVIAEPETRVFADPFFALQLRGISKELTAHDSQLVLLLTEGRADHARVGRYLAGGHVDGALVFSLHLDDPLPELVQRAGCRRCSAGGPTGARATAVCTWTATTGRGPRGRAASRGTRPPPRRAHHGSSGPDLRRGPARRLPGRHGRRRSASDRRRGLHPGRRRTRHAAAAGSLPDLDAVFAANDLAASGACAYCVRRDAGCPRTSPSLASTTCFRSPSRLTRP